MAKKLESITIKGPDGKDRKYWIKIKKGFKTYTDSVGMDTFDKAMMEDLFMNPDESTTIVTKRVQKIIWLQDEEEAYDIPPSERQAMIWKLQQEDYPLTEADEFISMKESTPKSPDHRGRLRPGRGILDMIKEEDRITTYEYDRSRMFNVLFDEVQKPRF
jgi:hypothetical protein